MEEINQGMTVPLLVLVGGVISWCVWLTKRINDAEKEIAVNTSNDKNVSEQIRDFKEDLGEKIDKLEKHVNVKFEKITVQFDKVFDKIDQIRK
jgi:hypothetical protein